MPLYQFTIPAGNATLDRRAEVARAITKAHVDVTGAPATYVHCTFTEVPPASVFVAGEPVEAGRLVGILRDGRSQERCAELAHALADAWCGVTGDDVRSVAVFLSQVPGTQMLEDGRTLPPASEDPGARP